MKDWLSIRLSGLCFFVCVICGVGWAGWCAYTWLHSGLRVCWGNGSIGCTNNNYASREKCNKCGQPKEVAAMPAIAMPGVSVPTYSHYFARALGGPDQKLNIGLAVSGALQHLPSLSSSITAGVADKYGIQSTAAWLLGGNQVSGLQYVNPASQLPVVPKGWRNGDWICNCGFHNYSSRAQCKSCNASAPPALGTKRLASEEIAHDLENKRLNLGNTNVQQTYTALGQTIGSVGTSGETNAGTLASYPSVSSDVAPYWQIPVQFPQLTTSPALLGKGAKQWRNGDWMCSNCNNHNYASRSECNRCKTQRDATNHNQPVSQPVNAI